MRFDFRVLQRHSVENMVLNARPEQPFWEPSRLEPRQDARLGRVRRAARMANRCGRMAAAIVHGRIAASPDAVAAVARLATRWGRQALSAAGRSPAAWPGCFTCERLRVTCFGCGECAQCGCDCCRACGHPDCRGEWEHNHDSVALYKIRGAPRRRRIAPVFRRPPVIAAF